MAPTFLQSSFRTYKEDTNQVASWLARKALQCGYPAELLDKITTPPSNQPSTRLKGRARKEAKNAEKLRKAQSDDTSSNSKHIIKIKDFTTLAEHIVGFLEPVVQVPKQLILSLNRAIHLRHQHNLWSRENSNGSTDQANADESHSYFVSVLERTREILKPRMSSDEGQSRDVPSQADSQMENKFGNLVVDEPSKDFLESSTSASSASHKSPTEPQYEAEVVDSPEEKYLASHCLFQDVSDIRSFVRQLWASYQNGIIDLVATAITVNTAIDFVRTLELEYLQRYPEKSDFQDIVDMFYKIQCVIRGEDPTEKSRDDDPFNFNTYDLAEKCLLPTYILLSSFQNVLSPGHVPVHKSGCFGPRDLRTKWSEKTPRKKFQDDKIVLLEALADLRFMAEISSKAPLAEDELLRGVRQMSRGKDIPVWLVFATQCFLDAQHALEQDISGPHERLMVTAHAIKSSIELNLKFHATLRVDTWPRANDAQFKNMLWIIEEWIQKDVIAEKRKHLRLGMTISDPEPFRLLKQYPLLCGLFMFVLKTRAQRLGIDFVNAWGSVLYAGHLYNAVRQEGIITKPWKDMEILFAMHGEERIFVGDRPKGLEEYLKRFILCMGYSATAFAGNRRKGAAKASARGPRSLTPLCKVGALFVRRYCDNDRAVAWTRESITPIIEAKMDAVFDSDEEEGALGSESNTTKAEPPKTKQSNTGVLIRKPNSPKEPMSALGFLEGLANALHAESLESSIDFLRLHRFCWELLRKVNECCRPKLLKAYGGGYLEMENQLPFVVGYIFMTTTETSRVANVLLPRHNDVEVSSQLLHTAAGPLKDMIDSGAGSIEIQLLAKIHGHDIQFED